MTPFVLILCILVGLLESINPIPITLLVVIFGLIPVVKMSPPKLYHIELKTKRTNCECGGKEAMLISIRKFKKKHYHMQKNCMNNSTELALFTVRLFMHFKTLFISKL